MHIKKLHISSTTILPPSKDAAFGHIQFPQTFIAHIAAVHPVFKLDDKWLHPVRGKDIWFESKAYFSLLHAERGNPNVTWIYSIVKN